MYLVTGLGQVFKQRSKYKPAQLTSVTAHWNLDVPFRKNFGAFRQELSPALKQLVTAETDKKSIDQMLFSKSREIKLKETQRIRCRWS